jgi:CheY-like chemotaxis protein
MYKIAVIDDNETWCFVIQRCLKQKNYSVSTFHSANDFLAAPHNFDLALIDFSMPSRRYQQSIDGAELITHLRHTLQHPPILVLISAYFTEECLQESGILCADADACLSKSMPLEKILSAIEKLLQQGRMGLASEVISSFIEYAPGR